MPVCQKNWTRCKTKNTASDGTSTTADNITNDRANSSMMPNNFTRMIKKTGISLTAITEKIKATVVTSKIVIVNNLPTILMIILCQDSILVKVITLTIIVRRKELTIVLVEQIQNRMKLELKREIVNINHNHSIQKLKMRIQYLILLI